MSEDQLSLQLYGSSLKISYVFMKQFAYFKNSTQSILQNSQHNTKIGMQSFHLQTALADFVHISKAKFLTSYIILTYILSSVKQRIISRQHICFREAKMPEKSRLVKSTTKNIFLILLASKELPEFNIIIVYYFRIFFFLIFSIHQFQLPNQVFFLLKQFPKFKSQQITSRPVQLIPLYHLSLIPWHRRPQLILIRTNPPPPRPIPLLLRNPIIIPIVIIQAQHNGRRLLPPIRHIKLHIRIIPTVLLSRPIHTRHLANQVEGGAGRHSDVLVSGGVPDGALADELEGVVGGVGFEDADGAGWQGDAQAVFLGIYEFDFGLEFYVVVGVAADRDVVVVGFGDGNAVGFGDEFDLFFGGVVEVDLTGQGVHVVVSEGLFTEGGGRRGFSHHSHGCVPIIFIRRLRRNRINISSYQLNRSILILLPTIIINSDPPREIRLILLLIQLHQIIRLPCNPTGPVGHLTRRHHRVQRIGQPHQRRQRQQPLRQRRHPHPTHLIIDRHSRWVLQYEAVGIRQQLPDDSPDVIALAHIDVHLLAEVVFQYGVFAGEVILVVLLENCDVCGLVAGSEHDCLGLDCGCDVAEVDA